MQHALTHHHRADGELVSRVKIGLGEGKQDAGEASGGSKLGKGQGIDIGVIGEGTDFSAQLAGRDDGANVRLAIGEEEGCVWGSLDCREEVGGGESGEVLACGEEEDEGEF